MLKTTRPAQLITYLLSGLITGTSSAQTTAQTDLWDMCPADSVFTQTSQLPQFPNPEQIDISAVTIDSHKDGIARFKGHVLLEKNNFRLNTEELLYDKNSGLLSLPTALTIANDKMRFNSSGGEMNRDNQSGWFKDVQFVVQESHIQGSAPLIEQQSEAATSISKASFSSCEPGDNSWQFSASSLYLDHEDESGTARNVVIRVRDVPIFYFPYISFPLGEHRRSGILAPEIKFSDGASGNEFNLPYYWNIAPNQDATITPNYMDKRGLQLLTNYRYLTETSQGEIDLEYLSNDRVTEDDRYLSRWQHKTDFTPKLSLNINASEVSDSAYMADFGNSLDLTSLTHLEQRVDLTYRPSHWNILIRDQRFQTVDDSILVSSRPYRRTPQISFSNAEELFANGPRFTLSGEWVNFEHESSLKNQGIRSDLLPQFSWPMQGSAWFFNPSAGYRFTAYDITDSLGQSIDIADRELPIYQIDSGLFFERKAAGHLTQTLEPRLYYLYIPTVEQSDIPLFDTSEPDFSFAQLFRSNRFVGADRVGDANQLTVALTTRLLDDRSGSEYFSASIGQIQYFADREVNLQQSDSSIDSRSSSDLALEFILRDQNWSFKLSALQNVENNETEKGNFLYHYQSDKRHIFNAGYRFRRDAINSANDIEQTDLSLKLPISDNWSVLGRWNYSVTDQQDLENIVGLEYNNCCMAFRIVGRGYLTQDNNEDVFDRSIIFTLVLKGIGSTGKANRELERAILGFQPEY